MVDYDIETKYSKQIIRSYIKYQVNDCTKLQHILHNKFSEALYTTWQQICCIFCQGWRWAT